MSDLDGTANDHQGHPQGDASDGAPERDRSDLVVDFAVSHLSVAPGASVPISLPVTNTGEIIDGITAIVDGVDPDWVRLERPVVSVFPDETGTLDVWFDAPSDCPAGDYLVVIRLVSTIEPSRQSVHDFWLTVLPVASLALELTPQIVNGGTVGRSSASVTNTGNAVANVRVTALDPARDVDVVVDPGAFILPVGAVALVDIHMRGRRPWFGQPDAHSVLVTARVDDVEVERTATFNQRPRISRGIITMLILALIIALWALIFLFAINALRQSDPVVKATATSFEQGQSDIPLALIAASADGTITATTTGDGIARLTVEAYRVTSDQTLESSGSAATDEDGAFALPSLLPGTYVFRASGDGFTEVWFPSSPDAAGAERLKLAPSGAVSNLDMEMTGELGRILGTIALPPNTPDVALTVTATQLQERGADGGSDVDADASADGAGSADGVAGGQETPATDVAVQPFTVTQITTDGTIDLEGLPTPGTYRVTVDGEGFARVDFDQQVGGGDVTVINTVNVAAATGEISGVVLNQSGVPTGDVTVTLRSGGFTATATTPTTGSIGSYRFIGLTTPATYTLEFAAPRFLGTTIALELDPGEVATDVTAQIIGGSGTISGAAVSVSGLPVGGLKVEVVGVGFRQETATLTSSGAGGAAGSFSLANIPVPGTYTVTLSGDGVQTETLDAAFLAAGTRSVGTVVMVPVNSELSGTVRVGSTGAGLGQATVTLSNGVRDFVTVSASNPLGRYSFAAVADGTYTLTVAQNGFVSRVVLIRVEGGVDVIRDVALTAQAVAVPA